MTINLKMPDPVSDLKPRITVFGVGGAGGNAVNNMIQAGLEGVEFVVANTDAQALAMSSADRRIQMGTAITEGLGAGSQPQIGAAAAEEAMPEILDQVNGAHMVFITAGMGGGTGTGAAPVIARLAREQGILTIGVVTKPFQFEGVRRMHIAERGIEELEKHVDTLIVIPNQNLFRIANERTTFADAFAMADQVLYSGVAGITDLMVKEGLINLDFADVRTIMNSMGKAMMGTGEASGEKRAVEAAEAAISNPLLDDVSMRGARGLLISITGGEDLTLYEVDEAATRIRQEVDTDANIILGATFDSSLEGYIRVSVVATGIDAAMAEAGITNSVPQAEMSAPSGLLTPAAAPEPAYETMDQAGNAGPDVYAQDGYDHAAFAGQDDYAVDGGTEYADHYGNGGESYTPPPGLESDVTVRRIEASKSFGRHLAAPAADASDQGPAAPDPNQPYVPPQAQEPALANNRMPRVDEFPVVAQREIEHGGNAPAEHGIEAQKRKTGFLERLASVGIGRRDHDVRQEEMNEPQFSDGGAPQAGEAQGGAHPLRRAEVHAAPIRPASQAQKNVAPAPHPVDDEALEIPAFLRRQAN